MVVFTKILIYNITMNHNKNEENQRYRMRKKHFVILVIILIFISVSIFIYRPIPFHKDFFNSDSITVIYVIDNKIDNGSIVPNTKSITFNNDTTNFYKLEQIIEKYSYHSCIHTLLGQSSINGISCYFDLLSKGQLIGITDNPHIIINDKVYRVGYWGDAKVNNLLGELKKLLKN